MESAKKDAKRGLGLIWERSEPVQRSAPAPLSREAIVGAALVLAKQEGIEAVSLRNIAKALDVGPMRLYGYIDSKEELLSLLIDEIYGEMNGKGPLVGPWRNALTQVARRLREVAHAHPWFPGLLSGRPNLGPNALAYLEGALSAVVADDPAVSIDAAVDAVRVLTAYVIGAVQTEANELRETRESKQDEAVWREQHLPYLERLFAQGRFPTLKRIVIEHEHISAEAEFERGLSWVLDGIETNIRRRSRT